MNSMPAVALANDEWKTLEHEISLAFAKPAGALGEAERELFGRLVRALRAGQVRAATPMADGHWQTNAWVKQGILVGMRAGVLTEYPGAFLGQPFIEKNTMVPRPLTLAEGVRLVPGGAAVRDGAFLGRGVVIMAPSYVNIGAYVGEGTLIDSNALVGSCAQIGKNVHISAAAQIGGVLEPAGALPVVIEDDVLVGGNCGVYEGAWVRKRAVLAAGVILTSGTKVFDLSRQQIYQASAERPLTIPEGAVVVPGARALHGSFASQHGLTVQTPIIVKYRDEKTDSKSALEEALRPQ